MIRIEHLRKEYPTAVPLKDVNVEIHKGDVISVIGPSGTGKSTLIRCINLLDKPTSGKIFIGEEEMKQVFILFLLLPDQSTVILNNIRGFLGNQLGSYYLLLGFGIFVLTVFIACSKYGKANE